MASFFSTQGMMFGPEKYLKEHLEVDAIMA